MPFALGLTRGNLGEGGNAAEPDVVDPSPGLGDGGEQSVPAFGPHCRFCAGRMNNALWLPRDQEQVSLIITDRPSLEFR